VNAMSAAELGLLDETMSKVFYPERQQKDGDGNVVYLYSLLKITLCFGPPTAGPPCCGTIGIMVILPLNPSYPNFRWTCVRDILSSEPECKVRIVEYEQSEPGVQICHRYAMCRNTAISSFAVGLLHTNIAFNFP